MSFNFQATKEQLQSERATIARARYRTLIGQAASDELTPAESRELVILIEQLDIPESMAQDHIAAMSEIAILPTISAKELAGLDAKANAARDAYYVVRKAADKVIKEVTEKQDALAAKSRSAYDNAMMALESARGAMKRRGELQRAHPVLFGNPDDEDLSTPAAAPVDPPTGPAQALPPGKAYLLNDDEVITLRPSDSRESTRFTQMLSSGMIRTVNQPTVTPTNPDLFCFQLFPGQSMTDLARNVSAMRTRYEQAIEDADAEELERHMTTPARQV